MKLISLHIENFGKLSNFDYKFNEGGNLFLEENGWGKSTLATFIRVMFFGFQNANKNNFENERKKYEPWQGGVYGGEITFSVDDNKYRIERTFGQKKSGKEDSFVLYNASTNLQSKDYGEKIGEELFLIDADSFMRTVFIAQNDCQTYATTQIHAKIGDVAEHVADMGVYEKAHQHLSKKINEMSPDRKTGSIYKLNHTLAELENSLRNFEILDKEMEKLRQSEVDCLKRRKILGQKREDLAQKLLQTGKNKEMESIRKEYLDKQSRFVNISNSCEEKKKSFPVEVPEMEDLQEMSQIAHEITAEKELLKRQYLQNQDDEDFKILEERFKNGCPSDNEIDNAKEIVQRIRYAQENKTEAQGILRKEKRNIIVGGLISALLFALAAVLFGVSVAWLPVVFAALIVFGFVASSIVKYRNTSNAGKMEEDSLEKDREVLTELLGRCGYKYMEADVAVSALSRDKNLYLHIKKQKVQKQKELNALERECESKVQAVDSYLLSLGFDVEENPATQFEQLILSLNDFLHLKKERQNAKAVLDSFVSENPGIESMEIKETDMPENIKMQLDEVIEELDKVGKELGNLKDGINSLLIQYDDLDKKQENYESIKEELEIENEQYKILCKTKEHLEKAKESFGIKYMDSMQYAFDKYYKMLAGVPGDEFTLDSNLDISIKSMGQSREIELMSEGYKDLVGFCMRLALIEAMYKGEKPFLILDDPFVNIDNSKMKEAMSFLNEIAKEYQIIYFSCHSSRVPVTE